MAGLSELEIGSLTLVPNFSMGKWAYTATTANAQDKITATATVSGATIVIKNGAATVTNGQNATWAAGKNTVTVKVTNGTAERVYTVEVTKIPDARLSALSVGSLTLDPAFDKDKFAYTTTTSNATNVITATAADAVNATIVIKNGETTVNSGSAATWADGENTVVITVANGTETKTYTVKVTKE